MRGRMKNHLYSTNQRFPSTFCCSITNSIKSVNGCMRASQIRHRDSGLCAFVMKYWFCRPVREEDFLTLDIRHLVCLGLVSSSPL